MLSIGQYILSAAASVAALAISAVSSAAAAPNDAVQVYSCRFSARIPEAGYADLRITKSFVEDGSASMHVRWEDNQGSLLRLSQPGDRAFVSLNWPGEHRISRVGEPFDWSQGSITIRFLAADSVANYRFLPGEEWRQVVVDRNRSVMIHERDGMSMLYLPSLDLHLVSDLEPPSSPGRFSMSLDSFLAWGSGTDHLTVYETRVTRREPVRNSYPTSPAGRHRIVGAYDVDIAALARAVVLIRETSQRWEAGISSTWRQCESTTEDRDIIVTDARISRPH